MQVAFKPQTTWVMFLKIHTKYHPHPVIMFLTTYTNYTYKPMLAKPLVSKTKSDFFH